MLRSSFFPQASSTPVGISVTDLINAEHDFTIRHLINNYAMEAGVEGKGTLIDLQVSLDRLALEIRDNNQEFAAKSAIALGYSSAEAAHKGLLGWADGTNDRLMVEFKRTVDELSRRIADLTHVPPIASAKSPEELEREQQVMALVKLSAKAYQDQCKKLSNAQLASGLINEALELIQARHETKSSVPL